jgi:hypothetical protein
MEQSLISTCKSTSGLKFEPLQVVLEIVCDFSSWRIFSGNFAARIKQDNLHDSDLRTHTTLCKSDILNPIIYCYKYSTTENRYV